MKYEGNDEPSRPGSQPYCGGSFTCFRLNPHFPSIVDIQCGEKAILL